VVHSVSVRYINNSTLELAVRCIHFDNEAIRKTVADAFGAESCSTTRKTHEGTKCRSSGLIDELISVRFV
jgi:hypothetical protein